MTPKQRTDKIKLLMIAKDHMEKGLAFLEVEGYNKYNVTYSAAKAAITTLRQDIIGLQTGDLPIIAVLEEAA